MEIINGVKENDSKSFEFILNEYHKMICSIVNEYGLEYGDYKVSKEDLYQEACLGLFDACMSYKDDKGSKFSTFAYIIIKRRLIRYYRSTMNNLVNECVSLDASNIVNYCKTSEESCVSDNEIMYRCEENLRKGKYTNNVLSSEDREIVLMRLDKCSYEEIANKLNITTKRVDNRLARLRRKYITGKKING